MRCVYLLKIALTFHFRNMETIGAAEYRSHLAYWSGVNSIFKRIDIAEWLNPTQRTFCLLCRRLLRVQNGHFCKLLWLTHCHFLATFLHFLWQTYSHALTQLIDLRLGSSHGCRISIHRTLNCYMRCLADSCHAIVAQHHQTINGLIVLHVFRGSLCTITCQFFLECFGCIHTLSFRFCNF